MRDDEYEPNRFLGFPVRTGPQARNEQKPRPGGNPEPKARTAGKPRAGRGGEPQRVMGFPVDLFSDREWLAALAHPVRDYQRWRRRRAPSAAREDDPRDRR